MSDPNQALRTRRRLLAETFWVATAALLCRDGTAIAETVAPPSSAAWPKAAFPLGIPAGKRYLEDAAGQPFLIHGDTAWSLIAQLAREDAEAYLQDR